MGLRAPLQARPVDMGLPSGVQWASCNIGAERPSESGLYFSWGNTEGHAEGSDYPFSQQEYDTTPAADISTNLSLSEDAANAYLGGQWRMPTAAEFNELRENCTVLWTTLHGVAGRLFTSNINGSTIFLPAVGYYNGTSLRDHGTDGYYWSATYNSATIANNLSFNGSNVVPQNTNYRRSGFPVRAVLQPS